MHQFTRIERGLFVAGVLTTGLVVTGLAVCEQGSPVADAKDFSGGPAKCYDAQGGDDSITGSSNDDSLYAGPDDDLVFAGDGNDRLYGENGDDSLHGEGDDDLIYGAAVADGTLSGGSGDDQIYSGGGADIADGGTGDDLVEGDAGFDSIGGEGGADTLNGGNGEDQIIGGTTVGGAGADVLRDYVDPAGGAYIPDLAEDTLDAKDQDSLDVIYAGVNDWLCADDCDSVEVYETVSPFTLRYGGRFGDIQASDSINMQCTPGSCP